MLFSVHSQKWKWAGHIARLKDNRWTRRCTEWQPRRGKRSRGRPSRRWQDDITEKEGTTWIRKATDRRRWKTFMEGYILQWMDKAQMKIKMNEDDGNHCDDAKTKRHTEKIIFTFLAVCLFSHELCLTGKALAAKSVNHTQYNLAAWFQGAGLLLFLTELRSQLLLTLFMTVTVCQLTSVPCRSKKPRGNAVAQPALTDLVTLGRWWL